MTLSPKEQRVMALTAQGLTRREIAHDMGMSIHTLDGHRISIYAKLGAHSVGEAVAKWIRRAS